MYYNMTDLKTTFPNATVIDGINQSSATITTQIHESFDNRITILELPPKGSANDKEVKLWDQVMLTKEYQAKAKRDNIPYEMEWFVISKINTNADGTPSTYNLSGSMGGGWVNINWNQPNMIDSIVGNMMS
jgi:hypothetical protein